VNSTNLPPLLHPFQVFLQIIGQMLTLNWGIPLFNMLVWDNS